MGMRTGPALLAVAVLLTLAGCVPSTSHPTAAPSASATPVFASDAEALAAAEKAYAAYLKVSAEITADGGTGESRIDPLVTKAQAIRERATYQYFVDRKFRTTGAPVLSKIELQQVTSAADGVTEVGAYVCVDATDVRIIDSAGGDAIPEGRVNRTALQITMQSSRAHPSKLLVSESTTWSGPGICT